MPYKVNMAFSWRRLRKNRSGSPRPRDLREDLAAAGHYADAPVHDVAVPYTLAPHNWNTLWGAAALGYTRILARMIARGASVNERDPGGRTALYFAVDGNQEHAMERLLAAGADPDLPDDAGKTPLHLALARRSLRLAERLLVAGASPEGSPDAPETPLMEAVQRGDLRAVLRLLRAGASLHATDRWGHTPLFFVNGHSAAKLLSPLLDAGADPAWRAHDGDTFRHRALRVGDERLWRALSAPDDEAEVMGIRGRMGDTPLIAAAESGNPNLVKRLLRLGADVSAVNDFGHSALLVALTHEDLPTAAALQSAGAPIGFLEAVALGDYERAVDLPTPPRADLSAPICGQETPLMGAIARGRDDLTRLLLARGARLEVATRPLGTVLDVAVLTGHPALVRLLIERGADPGQVRKVHPREVRAALREAEAEPLPPPDGTLSRRPTAADIYAAATAPTDEDLRWLRLLGANIDERDEDGNTALALARRDSDDAAARRLLAFGATERPG
jgi:ankyrin repeat protein